MATPSGRPEDPPLKSNRISRLLTTASCAWLLTVRFGTFIARYFLGCEGCHFLRRIWHNMKQAYGQEVRRRPLQPRNFILFSYAKAPHIALFCLLLRLIDGG